MNKAEFFSKSVSEVVGILKRFGVQKQWAIIDEMSQHAINEKSAVKMARCNAVLEGLTS